MAFALSNVFDFCPKSKHTSGINLCKEGPLLTCHCGSIGTLLAFHEPTFCIHPGDAGPGVGVPGDPPSQGLDSVNVSGHAVSALPHGNQCAVLHDTEPAELEDLDG